MAFGIPVARKIGQIHYWDGHGEEVSFYLKPLYCNDLLLKQVLLKLDVAYDFSHDGDFCSWAYDGGINGSNFRPRIGTKCFAPEVLA